MGRIGTREIHLIQPSWKVSFYFAPKQVSLVEDFNSARVEMFKRRS